MGKIWAKAVIVSISNHLHEWILPEGSLKNDQWWLLCILIDFEMPFQDRNVAGKDVVVWHSFGLTHIPR